MALAPLGQQDFEVPDPPSDSISSISFSGTSNHLAVGSWDNSVRVYEVNSAGQSQGRAMYQHGGPVLDVCWNTSGDKIFSGGVDNTGQAFDLNTGQTVQVAQHDAAIKSIRWINAHSGVLATGSWDKSIRYWDLRASAPIATVSLPERCYSLDVQGQLMFAGTANRHVLAFDMANPSTVLKQITSPLKWQTRVVRSFRADNKTGFAIGGVEGRVGIQFIEDKETHKNYSFRAHRQKASPAEKDPSLVYAVNDIQFHPIYGTLATCGSDGSVTMWDKDARARLKTLAELNGTVSSSTFNQNGTLLAYAVSYDWSKGYGGMIPTHPNKVLVHACKDEEMKKRTMR